MLSAVAGSAVSWPCAADELELALIEHGVDSEGVIDVHAAWAAFRVFAQVPYTGLQLWLREHKVRNADKLATAAMRAAEAQHVRVPGEAMAGELIARLATNLIELDRQLAELDKLIAERFQSHHHAKVITSMVGIDDLLGAEFFSATGGSLDAFASADHLAGYAGLAPTPRDSGRRVGNLHRPKRYNRQLQRVFYTSAVISIQRSLASRTFYDRKRPTANITAKRSSPWPGAASTCSGRCSATAASTTKGTSEPPSPLDKQD
jgi:hypothetical protein